MTKRNKNYFRERQNALAMTILIVVIAICGPFTACTRSNKKSANATEKITFAYTVLPDAALVQVAQQQGYYQQEGLDVTPQVHQIGKTALDAVMEGKADFATVAETPVVFAILKGEKISIIATINTSNKNMAIVARKDKGILSPHDLKGKKIGTTFGTIGEFFMDTMLMTNGISRKNMKVFNLAPEIMPDALVNGDVDAISTWNPILIRTQKKLGDKGITFYGEDIYTQTYNVVATQAYIDRNPGTVNKILLALIKAEEFAKQKPAEAQKVVADVSRTDMGLIGETWGVNHLRVELDQSLLQAMEDESRWAIKSGLVNRTKIPNYLNYIYFDGLDSIKPESVRILR
jgi:ABC-type nitrate/sulfonate/bicarbonate transport system substrate-binding protein